VTMHTGGVGGENGIGEAVVVPCDGKQETKTRTGRKEDGGLTGQPFAADGTPVIRAQDGDVAVRQEAAEPGFFFFLRVKPAVQASRA
jgi:hypothetical protein